MSEDKRSRGNIPSMMIPLQIDASISYEASKADLPVLSRNVSPDYNNLLQIQNQAKNQAQIATDSNSAKDSKSKNGQHDFSESVSIIAGALLLFAAEVNAILQAIPKGSEVIEKKEGPVLKIGNSEIAFTELPCTFGATEVIPEISQKEAISFYEFLSKTPLLGLKNETGLKILTAIQNYDKEKMKYEIRGRLLHGRIREDNNREYTEQELSAPPYLSSKLNRFNMPGISSYYLTENRDVILRELGWKEKDNSVDVAIIEVTDNFCLLDLTKRETALISRCYISSKSDADIQAYIIPNFIADCCRLCEIDGIIYKSVKDGFNSTNYVIFNMKKNMKYIGKYEYNGTNWTEYMMSKS